MEGSTISARRARFGAFEVDLRAGELRKQGLRIKLQEQPLQVLAMLLQHPGDVVTREELQKKLWPADTFVDLEHGLNKAITKIREALGDSADNPLFIETLPRRGYRFIAPVSRPGDSVVSMAEPPVTTSRGLARGLFILIQVGYLAMYGAAFYYLPAIQRLSLILPVRNLAVYVVVCALCGSAFRLYLLSAAALDYPNTGRLFKRLFPGILLIDLPWSASPILLFYRLGEFILLFVAGLAFLPFSQRSLLRAVYASGDGHTSAEEPASSR
jgi:DNA-binding winged helix-turn-helix (wHTH) protein